MSEARDTGAVPAAVRSATAPGAPELPYAVPAAGLRRTTWLALLVLALAAGAAYHDSFHGPFVFDDVLAIQNNPDIRSFATTLRENPAVDTATAVGRPLLRVSLWANYALGGLDVRGYHAVNLLLHLAAAFTLFAFTRRLLASPRLAPRYAASAGPLALAIALLWTVHPLQSESVTYVVQRAEMLGALFYLLTLYAVVRCAEASVSRRGRAWAVAAVLSCLLGMASKETLATAPLVALAMDRIFFSSSWSALWRARRGLYLALAATWIFQAALVLSSAGRKGTVGFALSIAWWEYALTQPYYLCRYLALSLWPGPLVFDYGSYVARGAGEIAPYLLVVLALGALTLFALWRRPVLGFLGLWFFALLGPTSSVVPVVTQTGAEHRMYLPLAAVVALAVLGVHALARRHPPLGPRLAAALLVLATLALGTRTVLRNRDYRDEITLWQGVVDRWPGNWRAFNNLGNLLGLRGLYESALPHYEASRRLQPNSPEAHNNLGFAFARLGRYQDAIDSYNAAIRLDPGFAKAHDNLGDVLAVSGRPSEATPHYRAALRLNPDLSGPHNGLGKLLASAGQAEEATAHYREALRLSPDFAEAHNNLAWLLATASDPGVRDPGEALRLAERAVALTEGKEANYLDTLAAAQAAAGRFGDAAATAERAVALARTNGQKALAAEIEPRLARYREGKTAP